MVVTVGKEKQADDDDDDDDDVKEKAGNASAYTLEASRIMPMVHSASTTEYRPVCQAPRNSGIKPYSRSSTPDLRARRPGTVT
eukprot:gene22900-30076_t